jgi:hypothetical protein
MQPSAITLIVSLPGLHHIESVLVLCLYELGNDVFGGRVAAIGENETSSAWKD